MIGQPMDYGAELSAADIQGFTQGYAALTQIWPDFLSLGPELANLRQRYLSLSSKASLAGDMEAARAYSAAAGRMTELLRVHQDTVGEVNGYRETWESIKGAIRSAGQWIGLGVGPVVIVASAVAAIAALALIVNRYQTLRAQVNREKDILAKIEAGAYTVRQGAELIRAGATQGGILDNLVSAAFSSPLSWIILIGGALLVMAQATGRR